jgi:hypothetical protein
VIFTNIIFPPFDSRMQGKLGIGVSSLRYSIIKFATVSDTVATTRTRRNEVLRTSPSPSFDSRTKGKLGIGVSSHQYFKYYISKYCVAPARTRRNEVLHTSPSPSFDSRHHKLAEVNKKDPIKGLFYLSVWRWRESNPRARGGLKIHLQSIALLKFFDSLSI